MALTVGVDSYTTLADALVVAQESALEGAEFVALNDTTKQENALKRAARAINAAPFPGVRLVPSQTMALPRSGLRQGSAEQLNIAKQAQILYAMYIAPGFKDGATASLVNPPPSQNGNIKRSKEVLGELETDVEYFEAGSTLARALSRFPDDVHDLLSQLVEQARVVHFGQGKAARVS